jgi:hypothetical protein
MSARIGTAFAFSVKCFKAAGAINQWPVKVRSGKLMKPGAHSFGSRSTSPKEELQTNGVDSFGMTLACFALKEMITVENRL